MKSRLVDVLPDQRRADGKVASWDILPTMTESAGLAASGPASEI
jgi:hypothetical protein